MKFATCNCPVGMKYHALNCPVSPGQPQNLPEWLRAALATASGKEPTRAPGRPYVPPSGPLPASGKEEE